MWVVVFIFITDLFVNIIIFGVQRPNFSDWCIDTSRQQVQDQITNNNGTVLDFTPNRTNSDLYNCDRLWQDELKFAIVLFIMITICFVSLQLKDPSSTSILKVNRLPLLRSTGQFVYGRTHKSRYICYMTNSVVRWRPLLLQELLGRCLTKIP